MHLHAPLDGEDGFDRTKAFAREVAHEDPGRVTDRMPVADRAGKVLVDWRQNDSGRSIIAPYSLRAPIRGLLKPLATSGAPCQPRVTRAAEP